MSQPRAPLIEWPTLAVLAFCYLGLMLATVALPAVSLWLAVPVTAFFIALHSSLQHEILHGHPTPNRLLNEALVFPAVGLFIPYRRFRALHIAHHNDNILTDPYEDPESNFMDPARWQKLPPWLRRLYRLNNTLLGRILLGPGLSLLGMVLNDLRGRGVGRAWLLHALGLLPVFWWLVWVGAMPVWAYLLAAYLGFGLLKIRTYLEHRADARAGARSVVIEDRGILAFLFLNNNYHIVHHSLPSAPWYRLRALYFAAPEAYLQKNGGYRFANYREVFRRYLLHAKDPVPHPLWPPQ